MNKYLIFASLLLINTQQITFSMETKGYQKITASMDDYWDMEDPQTEELHPIVTPTQPITNRPKPTKSKSFRLEPTNTPSLDEDKIISLVNESIFKKYNGFLLAFGIQQLTEKDFFDIINTINKYSSTPNVYTLSLKDPCCKQAINYFKDLARKNIDNVTIDTIEIILNTTLPQPTAQLNQLPIHIKKILISDTYDSIEHPYDITLTGHTDTINFFDICNHTHRAATSSLDKTLRLWDLTTGKLIRIFPGDNNITHYISFSPDGSQLATATNHTDNTSIIKIWKTQSAQLLINEKTSLYIHKLCYRTNDSLVTHDKLNNIRIFSINKDYISITSELPKDPDSISDFDSKHMKFGHFYSAKNPYSKQKTLTITKTHNRLLYLCEQVVKNTHNLSLKKLIKLPLFQTFTQYEKNKIYDQLLQKNMQPLLEHTFRKVIEEKKQTNT